jgi:hypothetical protein
MMIACAAGGIVAGRRRSYFAQVLRRPQSFSARSAHAFHAALRRVIFCALQRIDRGWRVLAEQS